MSDFDFHFDIDADGVAVLALDRPDTLNSLTFEVYGQLERLFVDLQTDKRVKAIVLTGRGKGFCSGGSVDEIIGPLLERDLDGTLAFTRMTGAVVRNMLRLEKPIVAAINGVAAGAGSLRPSAWLAHEGAEKTLKTPKSPSPMATTRRWMARRRWCSFPRATRSRPSATAPRAWW